MIRRIGLVVGCVAAIARPTLAQETALLLPGDRDASAQLSKIIETTAAAGLPTDPILSKVHYGVRVARVPAARIVAAARLVAARLEDARVALAPNASELDIRAGADALGERATKDALRKIRRASGGRPMAGPLGLLAQLLVSGVELDNATAVVTDLIKRGATDAQLVALGNDVNADVAAGAQATASVETRVQGLAAVLSPGGTASAADAYAPISAGLGQRANPPPPPPPRRP